MANVFGILTAIVLALSAFVAHQNKDRYDLEITNRKKSEDTRDKSAARLKQAQSDLADTTKKRKDTQAKVADLTKEKTGLESTVSKLKSDLADKTALSEQQKAKLEEIRTQLEGAGNIDTLGGELKATKAAIETLNQTIASSEATLANLVSDSERIEKVNENFRTIGQLYPSKKSNPALKTRLVAIYPNWGFVTLGAGNNSGVVTNSTLDVIRGGETIAKLVVTAAEGSTASASIVPDSLKADTVLMVGDSVVPTK